MVDRVVSTGSTAVRRPRPFSLATGVGFVTVGLASIIHTWTPLDTGGVAALALLFGGAAALTSLATRRAPSDEVDQN